MDVVKEEALASAMEVAAEAESEAEAAAMAAAVSEMDKVFREEGAELWEIRDVVESTQ